MMTTCITCRPGGFADGKKGTKYFFTYKWTFLIQVDGIVTLNFLSQFQMKKRLMRGRLYSPSIGIFNNMLMMLSHQNVSVELFIYVC